MNGRTNKRAAGIEPAWLAWKARALPLSYARDDGWTLAAPPKASQALFSINHDAIRAFFKL